MFDIGTAAVSASANNIALNVLGDLTMSSNATLFVDLASDSVFTNSPSLIAINQTAILDGFVLRIAHDL